jgi:malate synthase
MPQPNQIDKQLPDYTCTADDLLEIPIGTITEAGLNQNVAVGLGYLEAWLRGIGCVPLFNLMEDAATAEISRAQLWQWLQGGAALADGRSITAELYDALLAEELAKIQTEVGADRYARGHFPAAVDLFMRMVKSARLDEFLTLPAYELLP